jgi:excisionase family DNA binding protein
MGAPWLTFLSEGGFAMPTKPKPIPTKCLSIREAAHYLDVHPSTITRLIQAKKLRAARIGTTKRGRIRIDPGALQAFLDENPY